MMNTLLEIFPNMDLYIKSRKDKPHLYQVTIINKKTKRRHRVASMATAGRVIKMIEMLRKAKEEQTRRWRAISKREE